VLKPPSWPAGRRAKEADGGGPNLRLVVERGEEIQPSGNMELPFDLIPGGTNRSGARR